MATTIPGGKYLSTDGKTYHDANGNVLNPEPTDSPVEEMAQAEETKAPKVRKPKTAESN